MAADMYGEVAQGEAGVGKAEAERKQRLLAPLEEPFIADCRALIVRSREHRAVTPASSDRPTRRAVRIALDLRMGQLIFAGRKGDREASRRVGGAGEDCGNRLAAFLAGVPGFENSGGLFEPGHEH